MGVEPEVFMANRRDARQERDVQKWLRSLPNSERLKFVTRCLETPMHDNRAFDLAVSCISCPEDALSIVRAYFSKPDASGIKWWLRFGISKLGAARVVREVASYLDTSPDTVRMALYWLPGLVPLDEAKAVRTLSELRENAKSRGIINGPKTKISPDGKVLFCDIYDQHDGTKNA